MNNFIFHNPTKIYFTDEVEQSLEFELSKYGKNIVLVYGCGSVHKNGIFNQIVKILDKLGKNVAYIDGVMPNPTLEKLNSGVKIAREHKADFLLALGGGSVCDYTKALAVSINSSDDYWDRYFINQLEPTCDVVSLGCILTMCGTGSEMNGGSVITNEKTHQKIGKVFNDKRVFPKFSILNPKYTLSLSKYQMINGIYDAFNHILEQYFSKEDDNVSDYLAEGLMRSIISSSKIANKNPNDYKARSDIVWASTLALNTMLHCSKNGDWMVHMIGQAIGGFTNATHGATLSAISLAYYEYIMPYNIDKFKRFAINVWGIKDNKSDEEIAKLGLFAMRDWMNELGLCMNIKDLLVDESLIEDIANNVFILNGGYKELNKDEIIHILKKSF